MTSLQLREMIDELEGKEELTKQDIQDALIAIAEHLYFRQMEHEHQIAARKKK